MKKIGKLKTFKSSEIKDSYISIGFECLDRELFKAEKCYEPLGKTGVKYARCQTGWCRCEKEKGVYDFKWLDDVVDSLLANGVQPWFNIGYGNPIYMDDIKGPAAVGCVPLYYGEETLEAWCNYVAALTKHFKDRVTHYEIWNEADIGSFWYPKKTSGAELSKFSIRSLLLVVSASTDGCSIVAPPLFSTSSGGGLRAGSTIVPPVKLNVAPWGKVAVDSTLKRPSLIESVGVLLNSPFFTENMPPFTVTFTGDVESLSLMMLEQINSPPLTVIVELSRFLMVPTHSILQPSPTVIDGVSRQSLVS